MVTEPSSPPATLLARVRRDPLWRLTLALGAMSAFAVGMVVFRHSFAARATYDFLHWNLFLAWIPLGAALLARRLETHRHRRWSIPIVVLGWLAFFPNAPYILTDLMHLRTTGGAPLWLDVLMVGTAALTGLFVGLASLRLVHGVVARARASAWQGWLFATLACFGAGFGVYLGRFLRLNSWDIVTRPGDVLAHAVETLTVDRAIAFTLMVGALLLVCHVVVTAVAGAPAPRPHDETAQPE